MKKFLTLVSIVAVAGAVGTASAMDRTGKIGLGMQESFSGNSFGNTGTNSMGAWSVKYGVTNEVTGQFIFGFTFGNKATNRAVEFGARLLYNLVTNENSAFYTGVGIGWNQDKLPADNRALRFQVPLGWEFSFSGLPEVGFSAEAGIMYDYFKASKTSQINSVGGAVGGNLGLGVHYYF